MKVIICISEKGGVGKTTNAVTLACGFAAQGQKVLLIDTDVQGHVATAFGYSKVGDFFQLMHLRAPWQQVLKQIPPEKYLTPGTSISSSKGLLLTVLGNADTRALPYTMSPDALTLHKRLQELLPLGLDKVIIDCGPAAGLIHLLLYTASDYALFFTQPEYLAFDGLTEAIGHMDSANDIRQMKGMPPVQMLGIVPTMTQRSTEHSVNLADLIAQYPNRVIPMRQTHDEVTNEVKTFYGIRNSILWTEALSPASGHVPIYAHAPRSGAAEDALNLIAQVQFLMEAQYAAQTS